MSIIDERLMIVYTAVNIALQAGFVFALHIIDRDWLANLRLKWFATYYAQVQVFRIRPYM